MQKTTLSISLVLPGYNEEESIEEAVRKCALALSAYSDRYEIIVVDDGSTDTTGALADKLAREMPAVRVVHNPINLGVGTSLLVGFQAATGDLVLHNAMDYPFDLDDLVKVLPLFPEWDVVVIARTDRSAHSRYRRLASWVHYRLIRLLFRARFGDMNFVQMYKSEVLRSIRVKARSPSFVTPELLIRVRDRGFKIAEVRAPFRRRHKGTAHYGKARDILWALADMFSFWWERVTRKI